MDSKKPNKIREIVRLQQILKKWKKLANASKNINNTSNSNSISTSNITSTTSNISTSTSSKSIKFLKRTLSFTDVSSSGSTSNDNVVPKGFLAICVGKELKRYIIPTNYLGHQAFIFLLQEAEEEFGFQQEGVLKIPCEVSLFEKILKMVEEKKEANLLVHEFGFNVDNNDIIGNCCPSPSHHPQMCR